MKRRAFFGFMGGAAVAGPKLAQEIVSTQAPSFAGIGSYYGELSGPPDAVPSGESNWRARRISELRGLLSGEDPQIEKDRIRRRLYAREQQSRLHLDALRSVSARHKYQMLLVAEEDRAMEIARMDWKDNLARLLKEQVRG